MGASGLGAQRAGEPGAVVSLFAAEAPPGVWVQPGGDHSRRDRGLHPAHVALVGCVPRARWPADARAGDVVRVAWQRGARPQAVALFDRWTRAALSDFEAEGGRRASLLGVCVPEVGALDVPGAGSPLLAGVVHALEEDEQAFVVAAPALAAQARRLEPYLDVLRVLLQHCAAVGHRALVVDPPWAHRLSADAWAEALGAIPPALRRHAVAYAPWLEHRGEAAPPSARLCGLWARSDRLHAPLGLRVAPANLPLTGRVRPLVELSRHSVATLWSRGVNGLWLRPGVGVVAWGARTLAKAPAHRSVVALRVMAYLREQVRRDVEWAVFEPSRDGLYEALERTVRARLDACWEAGALAGEAPGDRYRVRCDRQLNARHVRGEGRLEVQAWVQPVSAAERIFLSVCVGES